MGKFSFPHIEKDGKINHHCFYYMGDTLDEDGGADRVATTTIRNGWMKFRALLPNLTSRAPPLEMKGQVYASFVRSNMTYGCATRPLLSDVGLKFERAEMQMGVWCFHEIQAKNRENRS